MTALGEWLRQIVLVVVLAVFADLLLPTKAMQKYVRMVMGLAIIAAMIQPVIPFFQKGWAGQTADLAISELSSATSNSPPDASGTAHSYQSTITQQEEKLADKYAALALQQSIEATLHYSVQSVSVTSTGTNVRHVAVILSTNVFDNSAPSRVQDFAAKQLGIASNQVTVTMGRG